MTVVTWTDSCAVLLNIWDQKVFDRIVSRCLMNEHVKRRYTIRAVRYTVNLLYVQCVINSAYFHDELLDCSNVQTDTRIWSELLYLLCLWMLCYKMAIRNLDDSNKSGWLLQFGWQYWTLMTISNMDNNNNNNKLGWH